MSDQHTKRSAELEMKLKELEACSQRTYAKLRQLRQHSVIKITDHAIVRFLEREKGIFVDLALKELITDQVINLYNRLGDGEYPVGDGSLRVRIVNGCIVTVLK